MSEIMQFCFHGNLLSVIECQEMIFFFGANTIPYSTDFTYMSNQESFCSREIYILQGDFFHIFITITKLSLACFVALTLISW